MMVAMKVDWWVGQKVALMAPPTAFRKAVDWVVLKVALMDVSLVALTVASSLMNKKRKSLSKIDFGETKAIDEDC